MSGRQYLLAAGAFVVLTAAAASAAPALTERHEDYPITGRTAVELRGQLDRLGPRDEADGKIYDANTRSELAVRYEYQTSLDSCRISSADIRLSVVYVMPRWADYDGGPREVRDSWDRYLGNLTLHEQGHRDVGMQVAADLERELLDMRGRFCEDVGKAADEAARSAFRILKERNREYDARTRHGAGQGTAFP
jgi:predicted secreted Zn-dependent protease